MGDVPEGPVRLLPRQGWDRPDRSPGSHTTNLLRGSRQPSRGRASVAPVKSPDPNSQTWTGVHTVAGQRRTLTCFPCIQHVM